MYMIGQRERHLQQNNTDIDTLLRKEKYDIIV